MPSPSSLFPKLSSALKATLLALTLFTAPAFALDVNKASAEDLQTVSGVGPVIAERIVNERRRGGKFASTEDLIARVKGVGDKTARSITSGSGLKRGTAPSKSTSTKSTSTKSKSAKDSTSKKAPKKATKKTPSSSSSSSNSKKTTTKKKAPKKKAANKTTKKKATKKKSTKKKTTKKSSKGS